MHYHENLDNIHEVTTVHMSRRESKWRQLRRLAVTYPLKQQVQGSTISFTELSRMFIYVQPIKDPQHMRRCSNKLEGIPRHQ
jgi:hypothetical protein